MNKLLVHILVYLKNSPYVITGYKHIQQALQRKVTLTELSFPQENQLFHNIQEVKKNGLSLVYSKFTCFY